MQNQPTERTQAARELARQLGRVLSAHRLYPDDPEQPGFLAAVDRVHDACQVALAVGAVRFEVRSGALYYRDDPLTGDEQLERLARECFERRVEELVIRSLPTAGDLFHFARVLSVPPQEVADRGGVEAMLEAEGVWAVLAGEMRPDPHERDALLSQLPQELANLYLSLEDPERLVSNLLIGGLDDNPAEAAQDLYGRFGSLHDALPSDVVGRSGTLRRMRETLDLLPEPLRREFFATVATRVGDTGFATNYVNHLTDPEVVSQLLVLGTEGGPDLGDVATVLVGGTGRPATIFPMLAEQLRLREAERDEAPTSLVSISDAGDPATVKAAVADALGGRLVDEASGDLVRLRELYPAGDHDLRVIARLAFRDYLRAETHLDHLERALGSWVAAARSALRSADTDRLSQLWDLIALDGEIPQKRPMLVRARDRVVTRDVVADLVEPSDDVGPLIRLLEPFGESTLEVVLDLLADEEDQARRAYLVGAAAGLTTQERVSHVTRRLSDDRWFVTRNLVTILGRTGCAEAGPHLIPLVDHPHPAVRREVVRALVQCIGSDAVTHLRRAAEDRDPGVRRAAMGALPGMRGEGSARALADIARRAEDPDDQQRAIESLAAHANPLKVQLLQELASRRSRPKLPRSLRKVARTAVKRAERSM